MPEIVPRPRQTAGRKLLASEVDDQWQAHSEAITTLRGFKGVFAELPEPVAANEGTLFHATDVGIIYRSTGSNWDVLAYTADAPEIAFFSGAPIARPGWIADATGVGDIVAQFNSLKNDVIQALGLMASPA